MRWDIPYTKINPYWETRWYTSVMWAWKQPFTGVPTENVIKKAPSL